MSVLIAAIAAFIVAMVVGFLLGCFENRDRKDARQRNRR